LGVLHNFPFLLPRPRYSRSMLIHINAFPFPCVSSIKFCRPIQGACPPASPRPLYYLFLLSVFFFFSLRAFSCRPWSGVWLFTSFCLAAGDAPLVSIPPFFFPTWDVFNPHSGLRANLLISDPLSSTLTPSVSVSAVCRTEPKVRVLWTPTIFNKS